LFRYRMVERLIVCFVMVASLLTPSGCISVEDPKFGLFPLSSRETAAAELSGFSFVNSSLFYAVGDDGAPAIWTLCIHVNSSSGEVIEAFVQGTMSVPLLGSDSEGVAYRSSTNSVFVSDEVASSIVEVDIGSGLVKGSISLPSVFRASNIQQNMGLEALSYIDSSDALFGEVWICNEEALLTDGPLSSAESGSWIRIQRFNSSLLTPTLELIRPSGQWAYKTDSIGSLSPLISVERSGVVDLIRSPYDPSQLMVLERECGGIVPSFRSRLYLVDISNSDDVSQLASLVDGCDHVPCFVPLAKTLLWEKSFPLSNFEGMTLGPLLESGSYSLLLLSDNGGGIRQDIYPLIVHP
jgi:hypothetical protein